MTHCDLINGQLARRCKSNMGFVSKHGKMLISESPYFVLADQPSTGMEMSL